MRGSRSATTAPSIEDLGSKNGTYVGGPEDPRTRRAERSRRRAGRAGDAEAARPPADRLHPFHREGAFVEVTLPAGTRLASYEILRPIASGGMGEVYRARDTKLARDVAVKVLPAELSRDAERLARFEKEARTASVAEPSQHRHDLRDRLGRRRVVHGDGARRGQDPARGPGRRSARLEEGAFDRRAGRRRPRPGSCRRDRASGPEAREPDGHPGRAGQDSRLRPGQARPRAASRLPAGAENAHRDAGHGGRDGAGHGRLHVSRAGERRAGWISGRTSFRSGPSSTR